MKTIQEVEALVQEAFSLGMIQGGVEARDFALFCQEQGIRDLIELGTCCGGTMLLLDRVCLPGVRISLDRPWDQREPVVPVDRQERLKAAVPEMFEVLGNIHDVAAARILASHLAGRQVDLLFADADHSYEGAKLHFQMYAGFVRKGGFFAMHDVANHHPCQEWWEKEITTNYKNWCFAETINTFGIGVAQL